MFKFLGFFLISIFIVGCGYKPAANYANEELGNAIYVEVEINRETPKNSVLIEDAVKESVITRLAGKLSSKEKADTQLYVKIGSTSFTAIIYDDDGYVIEYKATVNLTLKYITSDGRSENIATSGVYDFSVDDEGVISDTNRYEAIKYASLDALNEFISKIAVKGMKK